MVSCYDDAEEGRSNDPRVDGVTDQSKDDLERRTIEAVRLHRGLLRNAEHHHRLWRRAAETTPDADSDEAAPLFRDDCAPGFRDDLAPCFIGVCRQ